MNGTYVSLFSGIGGLDLAVEAFGFECVAQVEWDKHCSAVLGRHWPDVPRWADVVTYPDGGGQQVQREQELAGAQLESRDRFLRREHCDQACANTRAEVTKSALHWRARKHVGSSCESCGAARQLHVHHIDRNPANNEAENLKTFCGSCHLKLHWREDRDKRVAAARSAGVRMRQLSIGGKPC